MWSKFEALTGVSRNAIQFFLTYVKGHHYFALIEPSGGPMRVLEKDCHKGSLF